MHMLVPQSASPIRGIPLFRKEVAATADFLRSKWTNSNATSEFARWAEPKLAVCKRDCARTRTTTAFSARLADYLWFCRRFGVSYYTSRAPIGSMGASLRLLRYIGGFPYEEALFNGERASARSV